MAVKSFWRGVGLFENRDWMQYLRDGKSFEMKIRDKDMWIFRVLDAFRCHVVAGKWTKSDVTKGKGSVPKTWLVSPPKKGTNDYYSCLIRKKKKRKKNKNLIVKSLPNSPSNSPSKNNHWITKKKGKLVLKLCFPNTLISTEIK